MQEPHLTVTVVIPCYNQGRFLPAAIASAQRQTFGGALDVIVVDDGSTDDTRDVARHAGVTLVAQANRGLSEARNAGLSAARGELIVMLDADDELLPGAVSNGIHALASRPGALAAVGRCEPMDAQGRPLPASYHAVDAEDVYRELLTKNFVWTPGAALFTARGLREAGGFAPGLGPVADYAMYLQLARTGTIVVHERPVVRYRQHGGNMSRDPVMMLALTLEVLRRERGAGRASRAEIRNAERAWQAWYGARIVQRLRADWRQRRLGVAQARGAAALLRHTPFLLATEAARTLRHRASRIGRAVRRRLRGGAAEERLLP
jgi:glycosyltransferase involved in cell wall biosynthesis